MAGINELKVSLTKNGYFKVADVIISHPRNEILDNLGALDRAQIFKMLSGNEKTGELPEVWDEIRNYSPESVYSLVFISILFSHHKLITSFAESKTSEMRGLIKREVLGDKDYTNLVDTMSRAHLCKSVKGSNETMYYFEPLFRDNGIGPLAQKIFYLKLEQTGWKEPSVDEHFTRNFYEQCFYYKFHKTLAISEKQFENWVENRHVEMEEPPEPEVLNDKDTSVSASLVTSLRAKPFVILCGTTGTGKTRTIRHLVNELRLEGVENTFNHVFIPVEAGWTDARHLLGYKNPFGKDGETYCTTPLIDLLLRANYSKNANIPFFVILDEMNLSYVEKYFSKFLSLMETSYDTNREPVLSVDNLYLLLKSGISNSIDAAYIDEAIENGGLYLTPNVFIIGTVNVDETTHMFSPKVLDRAFVHQFVAVKPSNTGIDFSLQENDIVKGKVGSIYSSLISKTIIPEDSDINKFLDEIYEKLGKFRFGPRITNEVRSYYEAVLHFSSTEFECSPDFYELKAIKDRILMQKILPKLHGNKGQLSSVINALLEYARENSLEHSTEKLESMHQDLLFPGFTNYF